jgi:hypothetical protein
MFCTTIAGAQEASPAMVHARVWTGNASQPWEETLAANGDTILAVGDAASIQKLITPRTRVMDARRHGDAWVHRFARALPGRRAEPGCARLVSTYRLAATAAWSSFEICSRTASASLAFGMYFR